MMGKSAGAILAYVDSKVLGFPGFGATVSDWQLFGAFGTTLKLQGFLLNSFLVLWANNLSKYGRIELKQKLKRLLQDVEMGIEVQSSGASAVETSESSPTIRTSRPPASLTWDYKN